VIALGILVLALAWPAQTHGAADPAAPGATKPESTKPEPSKEGAPKRVTLAELDTTVRTATEWLVRAQNADGSWGSHHSPRPIEVLCNVPGSHEAFKVATTALAVMALADAPKSIAGQEAARQRGLGFLLEHFDVKRASGLEHYNVWSFGYTLQCFGEALAANPEDPRAAKMRAACDRLVAKLGMYQTLDGGWGYLSMDAVPTFQPSDTSMSFTTATIMIGMQRAKKVGIALPEKLVSRAIGEIERSKLPDGAFLYGDYLQYRPRMGVNQVKGSACRTPGCQYALGLFDHPVGEAMLVKGLEDLLVKHAGFQRVAVRRPIPHESWYQVSGYFYLYGHAYAAYVLEGLPTEQQRRFWPALVTAVMHCREPDGSFWDYPLYSYHKPYGTAFALIALARAQRFLATQRG
jgi:hypothetical protein